MRDDSNIDFHTTYDIANTILKWIYTDDIDIEKFGVTFLMAIMKVSYQFGLNELTNRYSEIIKLYLICFLDAKRQLLLN
jgi:hypothetical protein